MEPNKTNTEKRPLACEPSILSVVAGSAVSEALKSAKRARRFVNDTAWEQVLAEEVVRLQSGIACAANALTDSILCSGNDAETNMHFVRKLKALLSLPNVGDQTQPKTNNQ